MDSLTYNLPTLLANVWRQLCYDPSHQLMFSSGLFWVLFVLFVPVYAMLRNRRRQMLLFVAAFSLFFYYKSSGWCFLLMVFTSLADWHIARRMAVTADARMRRILLVCSLVCSLGILVFFKYTNFVLWNIDAIVGRNFHPLDIVLPVGISFYTFRTVSYVVDVYKRRMAPVDDYLEYLFFLSFFPALVAGPIVRAEKFIPQMRSERKATADDVYGGLWLVMIGLIKKCVIADYLAQYCNLVFENPGGYGGIESLTAMLGYTAQIYCDFSGYSDMAIGLGRIMGFDLGVNFDFPYRSLSVTEFWRRWHISLSTWLRDYLYIPLGGNRRGRVRQYVNLMVTMLLGGLWHGAAWQFIAWGFGHGAALCVHKAATPWLSQMRINRHVWNAVSWFLTFTFVMVMWVFFRASSFADAWTVLSNVVCRMDLQHLGEFIVARRVWCIMLVVAYAVHFVPRLLLEMARQSFVESLWIAKLLVFMVVVQLVIEFSTAEVAPFIYFQF